MISSEAMHWDFALILIFFATTVPLLGRHRIRQLTAMPETTKRDRLTLYASTVTFQWIATALVLWRTNAHGIPAAGLGVAIPSPVFTAVVAIVLSVLVLVNQLVSLRRLGEHPAEARGILPQLARKVFPQDSAERLVFLAVVVTVAVCEELIFRGFAQRVFQDWSGGLTFVGIFGSAALFAIAHLYQGRRGIFATFVVGLIFSAVRAWTGSLVAPLVAHFIADITAGFMAPSRLRSFGSAASESATEAKIVG
jgi:uncharacterized protein